MNNWEGRRCCRPSFMYHLFTDGSELAHASCGGWAYIRHGPEGEHKCNGFRWQLGNNQMELLAVINGLKSIVQPSTVIVHTDSNYVIVNSQRLKRNSLPLVCELHLLLTFHSVTMMKVTDGNVVHNQAHHLAREAMFNAVRVHCRSSDAA